MFKKIFTDSRFSVLVVSVVMATALLYQYSMGARLVYFLPNYPVREDSERDAIDSLDERIALFGPYEGYEKCDYYGSCFELADAQDLIFVEHFLLLILIYYAFRAGRETTWLKRIVGTLLVSVLYFILAQAKSLDWLSPCSWLCGLEYIFLWVPLLISLIAGFVYNPKKFKIFRRTHIP